MFFSHEKGSAGAYLLTLLFFLLLLWLPCMVNAIIGAAPFFLMRGFAPGDPPQRPAYILLCFFVIAFFCTLGDVAILEGLGHLFDFTPRRQFLPDVSSILFRHWPLILVSTIIGGFVCVAIDRGEHQVSN